MPRIWNRDCDTLEAWIQSATHGICEKGYTRIEREIHEHYRDAYGDAIDQGLTSTIAHTNAMKSLGNPKAARAAFRKIYLTRRESDAIDAYQKLHSTTNLNPSTLMLRTIAATLAMCLPLAQLTESTPLMVAWVLGPVCFAFLSGPLVFRFAATDQESPAYLRYCVVVTVYEALWSTLLLAFMGIALFSGSTRLLLLLGLLSLYFTLPQVLKILCVWSGLRKTTGTGIEGNS